MGGRVEAGAAHQLRAVDADHVVEGDARVRLHLHLGARAREVHRSEHAAAAAARAALTLPAARTQESGIRNHLTLSSIKRDCLEADKCSPRQKEKAAEENGRENERANEIARAGGGLGRQHCDINLSKSV